MASKAFDVQQTFNDEIKTNTQIRNASDKFYFRGLYVFVACWTLTFTLAIFVSYMEMTHLRSTAEQVQELIKSEVDNIRTRSKREADPCLEVRKYCNENSTRKGDDGDRGDMGPIGDSEKGRKGEKGYCRC